MGNQVSCPAGVGTIVTNDDGAQIDVLSDTGGLITLSDGSALVTTVREKNVCFESSIKQCPINYNDLPEKHNFTMFTGLSSENVTGFYILSSNDNASFDDDDMPLHFYTFSTNGCGASTDHSLPIAIIFGLGCLAVLALYAVIVLCPPARALDRSTTWGYLGRYGTTLKWSWAGLTLVTASAVLGLFAWISFLRDDTRSCAGSHGGVYQRRGNVANRGRCWLAARRAGRGAFGGGRICNSFSRGSDGFKCTSTGDRGRGRNCLSPLRRRWALGNSGAGQLGGAER